MIKIVLDRDSNEYELEDYEVAGTGITCVIDPTKVDWGDDVNWGEVAPEWSRVHGTVIVLLGSEEYPDTILGNPRSAERDIKGLSVYLNTRFWDLSDIDVKVAELRTEKKNLWPLGRDDRDDTRRPNNRRIMGAKHYLTGVPSTTGKLAASDMMLLDEGRVATEWYLWEGERPNIHMYAKKPGYIAVRYKDELFELTSNKPMYRNFGVSEGKVQQNLTIILEPDHYGPTTNPWGVHPDQSRNHLFFTGRGEKGVAMPMADWGVEFAEAMPEPILEAIKKVRGDLEGSIENEEYRKRLQDRFGARWTVRKLVAKNPDETAKKTGTPTAKEELVADTLQGTGPRSKRKRRKLVQHLRLLVAEGDTGPAVEMDVPVDVPRYSYTDAGDFEEPWHLALWSPHEHGGPTVLLNQDAPVLLEAIKYHQDQYPDIYADEVSKTVKEVYGEVAVAKIAHSQKLMINKVSEQELDKEYRSEKALTVALMGLLAEEMLIGVRLGKLGKKKAA
jgi:hypothetical protein